MNKIILAALAALMTTAPTTYAKDCTAAIQAAQPYKGAVATVSNVVATPVKGRAALIYRAGIRYDFTYPNGYADTY
jgi:hypothetical protein